jgi:hypothetical protein
MNLRQKDRRPLLRARRERDRERGEIFRGDDLKLSGRAFGLLRQLETSVILFYMLFYLHIALALMVSPLLLIHRFSMFYTGEPSTKKSIFDYFARLDLFGLAVSGFAGRVVGS